MKRLLFELLSVDCIAISILKQCSNSTNPCSFLRLHSSKSFVFLLLFLVSFTNLVAQRSGSLNAYGGNFVGFTIDGDTKTGYTKIYPATSTPAVYGDDWFKAQGHNTGSPFIGRGIIDVTDSANLRARLQAGENISFTKRMIGQPYDIGVFLKDYATNDLDTQFLVDGIYFRDYYANDYTAFSTAAKNGQNPNDWEGGLANTGGKSDIIDVFTHVRTSGLNPIKDSAWFFAGVATKNITGERYFDIEVYREPITFTPSATGTGVKFVSQGTSYGHSRWEINSSGVVTRTGDLIISVAYKSGQAPEIDFRIWLAKSTYDSVVAGQLIPKTFKLNGRWDVADDGLHGYAEITAETTGEVWGSGLGNYTGAANSDTTYATPWGTINTSGVWSQNYDQLQFVEIGLNFSRFGMNPFQYVTSFCKSPYASIMVKSRSSTAFNANLDDFVGPVNFTVKEAAPFSVAPEIYSCTNTSPKLTFNFSARNYYRLLNSSGDTLAKDIDFRTATTAADRYLNVSKPGTYKIEATNFQGCPSLSSSTITVEADTLKPIAKTFYGVGKPVYFLNGVGEGTTSATTAATPSTGLTYSWTGPEGFTSTAEDPTIGTTKEEVKLGEYTLTVREARNGCLASSMIHVYVATLSQNGIQLLGKLVTNKVKLNWNTPDITSALQFEIERSINGSPYTKIGQVKSATGTKSYTFTDDITLSGNIQYRIKVSNSANPTAYSNTISFRTDAKEAISILRQASSNHITIQLNKTIEKALQVKVFSFNGNLLIDETYPAGQPNTRIHTSFQLPLPAYIISQPVIVVLYDGANIIETKKL